MSQLNPIPVLPVGYVPFAAQRLTAAANGSTVITGTTTAGAAGYRRLVLAIVNEDTLLRRPAFLCRVGEAVETAIKIVPKADDEATIIGPFDNVGQPYYLRSASGLVVCEVSVLGSTEGEPEQLIAGA
jgi:hypothetical protein